MGYGHPPYGHPLPSLVDPDASRAPRTAATASALNPCSRAASRRYTSATSGGFAACSRLPRPKWCVFVRLHDQRDRIFMGSLYAQATFLPCFYDPVAKLQAETIQGCFVMDGIFLIVLIGFAALSAALLGLCAVLAPKSPAGSAHGGPHNPMPAKNSASDRGL